MKQNVNLTICDNANWHDGFPTKKYLESDIFEAK